MGLEVTNPIGTITQNAISRPSSGVVDPRSSGKALKDTLESEHPLYTALKVRWTDYLAWYTGEGIERYVFRHPREKEENYKRRQERAQYWNYVASIIDLFGSFVYSKEVTRTPISPEADEEDRSEAQTTEIQNSSAKQPVHLQGSLTPEVPEDLSEFWEDVDKRGTSVGEFFRRVFDFTQVFGFVDVVVDMPQTETPPGSEKERKESNLRPYAYHVIPLDVLNWDVGSDGRFLWVRWREAITGRQDPWATKKKLPQAYRYFTWTKENFFIHEVIWRTPSEFTAELVTDGANTIKEVPVVRFFNKRSLTHPIIGQSALAMMGKINIGVLNHTSYADEEIAQKCLNILAMHDSGGLQGTVELGQNNVLMWTGEHAPTYLAPASTPLEMILKFIEKEIEEIYRLATLGGDLGAREARSGVSYSWEFNQTNRMLADKASQMEDGEERVHELRSKWLSEEWKGVISYPDQFNVERFDNEVSRVMQSKGAIKSHSFAIAVEKEFVTRAFSKFPQGTMEKIMQEIDNAPRDEMVPGQPGEEDATPNDFSKVPNQGPKKPKPFGNKPQKPKGVVRPPKSGVQRFKRK